MVQAVPSELKITQEYKDELIDNTEKILLSVFTVPQWMTAFYKKLLASIIQRAVCYSIMQMRICMRGI